VQDNSQDTQNPDKSKTEKVIEITGRQSNAGFSGTTCNQAVWVNDQIYFVDGIHNDPLGVAFG